MVLSMFPFELGLLLFYFLIISITLADNTLNDFVVNFYNTLPVS